MTRHYGLLVALAVGVANPAQSQQTRVSETEVHALCAAANALLTTRMEPGMLADLIQAEAKRHADAARRLGASDSDLKQFVSAMMAAYNQETITWEQIADVGQDCTNL